MLKTLFVHLAAWSAPPNQRHHISVDTSHHTHITSLPGTAVLLHRLTHLLPDLFWLLGTCCCCCCWGCSTNKGTHGTGKLTAFDTSVDVVIRPSSYVASASAGAWPKDPQGYTVIGHADTAEDYARTGKQWNQHETTFTAPADKVRLSRQPAYGKHPHRHATVLRYSGQPPQALHTTSTCYSAVEC